MNYLGIQYRYFFVCSTRTASLCSRRSPRVLLLGSPLIMVMVMVVFFSYFIQVRSTSMTFFIKKKPKTGVAWIAAIVVQYIKPLLIYCCNTRI